MVTSPPTRRPITELATRTRLLGRRSKAAREGNREGVGTHISGRYGDFAGADGAAWVRARGVNANN